MLFPFPVRDIALERAEITQLSNGDGASQIDGLALERAEITQLSNYAGSSSHHSPL